MKKNHLLCSLFLMFVISAGAAPAHSSTFTNGGFEASPGGWTGDYLTINATSTTIPGWTVTRGSIDWINTYWTNAQGNYSIDLSGNSWGKISQTFDTVKDKQYRVTFSISGNPDGGPQIKDLLAVSLGSAYSDTFSFDTTGKTRTDMGWQEQSFFFTALTNLATIEFTSLTGGSPYGAALDNVRIEAVPIPAAAWLLGTGLIGLVAVKRRFQR